MRYWSHGEEEAGVLRLVSLTNKGVGERVSLTCRLKWKWEEKRFEVYCFAVFLSFR